MNSANLPIIGLILSNSLLTASPADANFDDSKVTLPPLTISQHTEPSPQPPPQEPPAAIREDFAYWSGQIQKDATALPAALNAFEEEWRKLASRKTDSTRDIVYASKALRTLTIYYVKLSKTNPEEANHLIQYINENLKPLKQEFHPESPYRSVYLNPPPGASLENNYANNIYNMRQGELRSFFIGLKRLKKFYPELQALDEMGDLLIDGRSPAVQK